MINVFLDKQGSPLMIIDTSLSARGGLSTTSVEKEQKYAFQVVINWIFSRRFTNTSLIGRRERGGGSTPELFLLGLILFRSPGFNEPQIMDARKESEKKS